VTPGGPASILVVCTGNICRSPIAHLLLQHLLAEANPSMAITVTSAGTYGGHAGEPAQPGAVGVLAERGIDASGFRASALTSQALASADLVLTAERSHRSACSRLVPSAAPRTFTIIEAGGIAAADLITNQGVAGLAASMHERRGRVGDDASLDVPDPYLEPLAVFRATLDLVERALVPLVGALQPAPR
jgi:protein-tyrosine phosphatase